MNAFNSSRRRNGELPAGRRPTTFNSGGGPLGVFAGVSPGIFSVIAKTLWPGTRPVNAVQPGAAASKKSL